jgi:hypothetical protein
MQRSILMFAVSACVALTAGPSYAGQRGHGGGSHAPHATGAVHGPSTQPHGGGGGNSSHGPQAKPAGNPHDAGSTGARPNGKASKKNPTTTAPGTLTPVQQKLQTNSHLADKLRGRLPAGTDLVAASSGFKNLGQFVAAVNVSNNLGIPFDQLKTRMVTNGMSLGQAIHDARPTADSGAEARRAEQDATTIIASVEVEASATTSTTAKPKAKPRPEHGSGK